MDQLKPRSEGFNLIVKVLNTNVVIDKNQNTRHQSLPSYRYYQGEKVEIARVAESLVGDETGTIIFTARNEQGKVIFFFSFLFVALRSSLL